MSRGLRGGAYARRFPRRIGSAGDDGTVNRSRSDEASIGIPAVSRHVLHPRAGCAPARCAARRGGPIACDTRVRRAVVPPAKWRFPPDVTAVVVKPPPPFHEDLDG